jgi:hypothetical protein
MTEMTSRWRNGPVALGVSVGYLAIVVGVAVIVILDATVVDHPDASMVGVLLFAVTLPLSLLLPLPDSDGSAATIALFAVPLLSGILQAVGLWFAFRGRPQQPR